MLAKALAPLALSALWSATHEPKAVFAGVLGLMVLGAAGLAVTQRATGAARARGPHMSVAAEPLPRASAVSPRLP